MTISHVDLNKPLSGDLTQQAVELYNLRRDNAALQTALNLNDDLPSLAKVDELVNLITNRHRNTNGFLLTADELAKVIHYVRNRQI
jgi:hypothetical protein